MILTDNVKEFIRLLKEEIKKDTNKIKCKLNYDSDYSYARICRVINKLAGSKLVELK